MQTEQLSITGMTCGGCVKAISRALQAIQGVQNVDVSLAAAAATVTFDPQATSVGKLRQAVQQAGYGAADAHDSPAPPGKGCCCG
jgi:copper chaperone CopZ